MPVAMSRRWTSPRPARMAAGSRQGMPVATPSASPRLRRGHPPRRQWPRIRDRTDESPPCEGGLRARWPGWQPKSQRLPHFGVLQLVAHVAPSRLAGGPAPCLEVLASSGIADAAFRPPVTLRSDCVIPGSQRCRRSCPECRDLPDIAGLRRVRIGHCWWFSCRGSVRPCATRRQVRRVRARRHTRSPCGGSSRRRRRRSRTRSSRSSPGRRGR